MFVIDPIEYKFLNPQTQKKSEFFSIPPLPKILSSPQLVRNVKKISRTDFHK